jgi:hypothetical protein
MMPIKASRWATAGPLWPRLAKPITLGRRCTRPSLSRLFLPGAPLYNLATIEVKELAASGMTANLPFSKAFSKIQFMTLAMIIFVLSVGTVIYQLGRSSLWVDEAYTWFFVRMPWGRMMQAVRIDAVNPPFFYIYAKALSSFLGTREAALRTPSALAQAIGLLGSMWVGYQLYGRVGSIAAGWFWGFHPMLLWFARDARPYATLATLSVLALGLFLHSRRAGRLSGPSVAGSVAALSLGFLTHYFFMLFAILTAALSASEVTKRRLFFRGWAVVLLMSLVPFLIWLWWFFQLPSPSFGIGWISKPAAMDLFGTLWNLLSGYGAAFNWGSLLFGVTAGILALAGAKDWWRWGALTVLLPIAGLWLLSQYRPVYMDRYFILLVPFLLPMIANGAHCIATFVAQRITPATRLAGLAGSALLVASTFGPLWAVHTQPAYQKEQWREVANWLDRLPPGTPILLSEQEAELPLAFYTPDLHPAGVIGKTPCGDRCAWVLRQPYTCTHAFSQSVSDPKRQAWEPNIPSDCVRVDGRRWSTGVATLLLACKPND